MTHTLVLGGIRSGKSAWAERLAAGTGRPVSYLATAPDRPDDPDWVDRVAAHRTRRPTDWRTLEVGGAPDALPTALRAADPQDVLLVDDVGNWLVGAFDQADAWGAPEPWTLIEPRVDELVAALGACRADVVLVSPEVGWTVVPATRSGRVFVDAQGTVNQRLAAACVDVTLIVAARALPLTAAPDSLLT